MRSTTAHATGLVHRAFFHMQTIWQEIKSDNVPRQGICLLENSSCDSPSVTSSSGDFLGRLRLDSEQIDSRFCKSSCSSPFPGDSFFFRLYCGVLISGTVWFDSPCNCHPTLSRMPFRIFSRSSSIFWCFSLRRSSCSLQSVTWSASV